MCTTPFGRGYVELGASFVHGASQANSVYNLASSYGLIEEPVQTEASRRQGVFLSSSGIALDQTLAGEVFSQLKTIEAGTSKLPVGDGRTLERYLDESVRQLKSQYPDNGQVHSLLDSATFYSKQFCSLVGGDAPNLTSAWGFGARVPIEGDRSLVGGYSTLLDRLLQDIDAQHLSLGESVHHLDWSQAAIQVKTSKRTYTADTVLVTFPLGVLKATHSTLFSPPLPEANLGAIERIGFGRAAKVYLEFERPFWQAGLLTSLKFLPQASDLEVARSGNDLLSTVFGFEEVPSSSNVLLAFITKGDAVEVEKYSQAYLIAKMTDILRRYTGDPSIPPPVRVLVSQWNANSFVRGFNSYVSLATSSLADFDRIRQPLTVAGKARVFFAGEATHRQYFASAHGARSSGLRAGQEIVAALRQ